jgi:hypothetical protein
MCLEVAHHVTVFQVSESIKVAYTPSLEPFLHARRMVVVLAVPVEGRVPYLTKETTEVSNSIAIKGGVPCVVSKCPKNNLEVEKNIPYKSQWDALEGKRWDSLLPFHHPPYLHHLLYPVFVPNKLFSPL